MVFTRTYVVGPNAIIDRVSSFPPGVAGILIFGERSQDDSWHRDDSVEYEYEELASMIQRFPAKIPHVDVCGIQESSPEYLKLLIAILNKADCLAITVLGEDAAYGCFMGSMLQQNGLRELRVGSHNTIMSTYQAELFFEGIASCPSLKKLSLTGNFSEQAGTALAIALNRNQSLDILELILKVEDGGTNLRDLFQAAITDKNILEFSMCQEEGEQQLPFDVMAEVLCTDNCTVKTLDISTIETTAKAHSELSNEEFDSLQNTSVTCYSVKETSLDCFRIMETVSLFRSIKDLYLCENQISDLSPLDHLLVGENLTLETLDLSHNRIGEKHAVEFFRKIPKMTCLRKVSFLGNPFVDDSSESWEDLVVAVAWQNRSLECINCVDDTNPNDIPKLILPLSLNRGGRRALESSTPLPANLWPNVLERAGKLSYFHPYDHIFEPPDLRSTRPDVVFWLLKEKMLGRDWGSP